MRTLRQSGFALAFVTLLVVVSAKAATPEAPAEGADPAPQAEVAISLDAPALDLTDAELAGEIVWLDDYEEYQIPMVGEDEDSSRTRPVEGICNALYNWCSSCGGGKLRTCTRYRCQVGPDVWYQTSCSSCRPYC